ncbi:hypothetical protein A9K55_007788 [Cordyceps militaris]|uniref:Uncharacterized protein n=1 Tax=Cordyceps militaris TaxID=73501 RepID=A0A2H4SJ13_CORMI|nr:hypothetical protein A9K55_007788 [Cordyceps militaris]
MQTVKSLNTARVDCVKIFSLYYRATTYIVVVLIRMRLGIVEERGLTSMTMTIGALPSLVSISLPCLAFCGDWDGCALLPAFPCAHFAAQNRVTGRGTDDCRTQRPFQLAWLVPGKAKASFVMSWTQPQQLGDKYQFFENYAFGEALLQIDVPAINKRQAKPNKMQGMQGAVALTLSPIIGHDSFVTQPALQFALSPIRGQPACSGTELARHAAFVPSTGLQAPLNSSAKSRYELQVGRRLASWQRAKASFQASGHWPPTLVPSMTRDPTTMVGGRPKRSGPMSWPKNPQQPSPCWSINITRPCWLGAGAARGFYWLMIPARQAQPVSFPRAEKEVQGYLADDWGNLASKPRRQPRQPTYLFGR